MRVPALARQVLLGWVVASVVLTLVSANALQHLWFADPDDAMRLLEVRDWLAGQSWFDVDQHRLWGGAFQMHWSRLVDLPLAAVIAILRPLLGDAIATRVALTAVPLIILLIVMALATRLTDRLAGRGPAMWTPLVVPLSVPILHQIRPARIDHHGWQIALALAAVTVLLTRARGSWRTGAMAGACLAALLTVSLEGLPITVAIVAVAVLTAIVAADRTRIVEARGLLLALVGTTVLLHLATRGPLALRPACDAVAPGWIAAMGIGVAGALVALSLRPLVARLGVLVLAGGAALGTLAAVSPLCLRGPFETLDPFVYRYWYRNVAEGLPAWQQDPAWAAMMLMGPVIGLAAVAVRCRQAAGDARVRWVMLLAFLAAGLALSLLVMRTASTANALALPGIAVALDATLRRARASRPGPIRIAATLAALLLAAPGLVAIFAVSAIEGPTPERALPAYRRTCVSAQDMGVLGRGELGQLPPATIFAPFDSSAALLLASRHRSIAGGYHRNAAAIRYVMETYMSDPARARARVIATGATYLLGCPGDGESDIYVRNAPNGLWARLERGERVPWLRPVPTGNAVLLWRVIPLQEQPVRP